MSQDITRVGQLRYGLLAMPVAFAGIPLYIHAPDFYASEYGLSLATLGGWLLMLRLIDAIQDPLIGRLSDLFANKRLITMACASIFLALGFAGLFYPSENQDIIWFAVCMLVATSAYSVLSVNLNSVGALWSDDYHTKTRITGSREAFALLGLLAAVILPSVFMHSMSKSDAFMWVSVVLAGLLLVALMLFVPWYRVQKDRFISPDKMTEPFWQSVKQMPAVARRFYLIYGISMLASAIPAVLILFFVRDRLNAESYTGGFLALYFISAVVAMPLWQYVSKRRNKTQAWTASMLLAVISFIWAFFLGEGDVVAFAIICVLSGVAFGADLSLPPSMLADVIQQHNKRNVSSFYFSVMSLLLKTAAGLAAAGSFYLLDGAGLQPAQANSEDALWYLNVAYALVPCGIKLVSVAMLIAMASHFNQGENYDQTLQSVRSTHHVS